MTTMENTVRWAARHHGSHRELLRTAPSAGGTAELDVIIVPSARTPDYLASSIDIAAQLGCLLVVLASKLASPTKTVARARAAGVTALVIDVNDRRRVRLPRFRTTDLLVGTRLERRTDTSLKRNLGLSLAYLVGWERILFLDDDVSVPEPTDLRSVARLVDTHVGVGLAVKGFPDNSVVCHAHRATGGKQSTFVGGGALAVGAMGMTSFFPNIYNEDWFFLLGEDGRLGKTTLTGRVVQKPFDPYANEWRARAEEFGDTLAEGVFALLDEDRSPLTADADDWHEFIANRRSMINDIIARVGLTVSDPALRGRMIAALNAALEQSELISPELCVNYLAAWLDDGKTWREYLGMPGRHRGDLPAALAALGVRDDVSGQVPGARRFVVTTHGTLDLQVILAQPANVGPSEQTLAALTNVLEVQIDERFRPRQDGQDRPIASQISRSSTDLFADFLAEQNISDSRVAELFAELLENVTGGGD